MRDTIGERPSKKSSGDEWLTPPELLQALGQFDLDPACPDTHMPWRTATRMVKKHQDGLSIPWSGRVWLNPPYSNVLPWIEKMTDHGEGMMLIYARSTDAKWGQMALKRCSMAYFLAGRILFYYPDGTLSDGKWCSNMLLAFGSMDAQILRRFARNGQYPGVLLERVKGSA